MAFPKVSDVYALARSLLADNAGEWTQDSVLFPLVQRAYRYAARYLRAGGVGLLRKQSASITIAAGTTAIIRPGAGTVYPADLLRPIEMREGLAGTGPWTSMKCSEGFLPPDQTKPILEAWDWRGDQIILPNHTGANVYVQILYEADLPALADVAGTDDILIIDGLDPISLLAASFAARANDEDAICEKYVADARADMDLIVRAEADVKKARGARWGSQ